MAKQKGRTLLIKIDDGTGTSTFETLCALQTKTITINNEEIDVTTPDCDNPGGPMWTEVVDGTKRLSLSGNGISKKEDVEARVAEIVLADTPTAEAQIIVPNFGTFEGLFFFQGVEFGGEQSGAVTMSVTLASTGEITFTPEV